MLTKADDTRDRWRRERERAERALGRRGEDLAHRYLQAQGFEVVARNYRTKSGAAEADIVAWEGERLVFVEVKTRRHHGMLTPESAVDSSKERRVEWAALEYTRRAGVPWDKVRFDVIGVVESEGKITHLRDAFKS